MSHKLYLNRNENEPGLSNAVVQVLTDYAGKAWLYPDEDIKRELLSDIARFNKVAPENVVLSNGSDELIFNFARAFLMNGSEQALSEVIVPETSFAGFQFAAKLAKAKLVPAKMAATETSASETRSLATSLRHISAQITESTQAIFLANPNNPTGLFIAIENLMSWLDTVPERVNVLLDEAYIEYAVANPGEHAAMILQRFPNVLITRTFSKAYGLAGLRIGYAIANSQLIKRLKTQFGPYNVNGFAMVAARTALEQQDHLAATLELNYRNREELVTNLRSKLKAKCKCLILDSFTNFICLQLSCDMQALHRELQEADVFCQLFSVPSGEFYMRISVGSQLQNQRLLQAIVDSPLLDKCLFRKV